MAFSASIRRAQVPKSCEMCEENLQTKWWCVHCKKYMCDKCKKIHLKVQVSVQHEIVDIKTARSLQDVQPQITTDNIPCQDHKAKMSCVYCNNCDKPVCPDCISTTHKKHDFSPIETVLSNKTDKLKGIQSQLSEDFVVLKEIVEQIHKSEIQCNSMLDDSITKIKQKEQSLKDLISKYSADLQTEVENERKFIKKFFSELKMKTNKTEDKILQNQNQIQTALSSDQGNTTFTVARELEVLKLDRNIQGPTSIKQFSPGDGTSPGLVGLFGSIQNIKLPQGGIDFEVVKSYTTNLPCIHQIITVDEKTAWISDYSKDVLQQVSLQDDKITTIKEIKTEITDMALTPNNDIFLSMYGGQSDVQLLTQSGEIKPYLSVSPLMPCGIHVTSDNDVIVGVTEPDAEFTTTSKSKRAVVIYGVNGKQWIEYDTNKQRLFTIPGRITTNVNNDIVVIDRTSLTTGRVVVVGREGGLRWTYEGNPQINANEPFNPLGIVTTSLGHIIVSDCENHTLNIVSREGDILVCKGMEDAGITYPVSLNIDRRGQLWIGCGTGSQGSGAKLHLVKCLQ